MELVHAEVDGLPAVWAQGSGGPLLLGLVFRVGQADETLARGGITHLVEHLALHRIGVADHQYNGATAPTTTTFIARGGPDEVRQFVTSVCDGLRNLPEDRLETERSILRTEADGRSHGPADRLTLRRYGPASYGLAAYPEFGVDDVSIDELRAWADRWFTRGNAVVWSVGGPPPDGLRIDLPDGPRHPTPEATSALPRLPAYFAAEVNGVAFDAVLPRTSAAGAYAAVLGRRLRSVLRQDLGLSYAAGADYDRRDADTATVTALADAAPDRREALVAPFVDVLVDLATGSVTDEDLQAVRALAADGLTHPVAVPTLVRDAAVDVLIGGPEPSVAETLDQLDRVGVDEIRAVAREALGAGLIMVPVGTAVGRAGFTQAPAFSTDRVSGPQYAIVNRASDKTRLVVADTGVSIVDGLNAHTVIYERCTAMLAYPDGGRVLIGSDGFVVSVEPTLWAVPPVVLKRIDAAVPAERVIRRPARDPGDIPTAPSPDPDAPAGVPAGVGDTATGRGKPSTARRAFGVLLIVLLYAAAVGFGVYAVIEGHAIFILIGSVVMATWLARRIQASLLARE